MNTASASAYYDFQSLAALRAEAVKAPEQAIGEVASQFESLFMQMMLKSMREATIDGGLFDSSQMELYRGMFDQQVSLQLSSQGTLGLSDILVEQLDNSGSAGEAREDAQSDIPPAELFSLGRQLTGAGADRPNAVVPALVVKTSATPASDSDTPVSPRPPRADWSPSTPEEFIREVWDHAVNAASRIGLDPQVLVAQSALETGWGKKVIETVGGDSSFNLFGIKAGRSWNGDAATVNTLEYRDGIASMEKASFRVYESVASSFDDYVDFLKSNPRYQQALDKVADTREFLGGLQDAGYATDPDYSGKILDIIGSAAYGALFKELKEI